MSVEDEIQNLLREHGAVLEREAKHKIYRFPDGRIFVMPKSASDRRHCHNALSSLRRLLGVERVIIKNPERRVKSPPALPLYQNDVPVDMPDWKQQLRMIKRGKGQELIEQVYKCDICGRQKGQENHWLVYKKPGQGSRVFEIAPWDCRMAARDKEYSHLCSETCAAKAMARVLKGEPMRPESVPLIPPMTTLIPPVTTVALRELEAKRA